MDNFGGVPPEGGLMSARKMIGLGLLVVAAGCGDKDEGDRGSGTTYGGGGGGSYTYTFTCDSGDSYTVDVPNDSCSSQSENYIKVFGCNEIDSFYDACVSYYGCYGQDTSQCSYY